MTPEHMPAEHFVDLANWVLGNKKLYADHMMKITRNTNGLDLEITRRPMPQHGEHLKGTNPTTMVKGREIIRHHGEHCYLVEHLSTLAILSSMDIDIDAGKAGPVSMDLMEHIETLVQDVEVDLDAPIEGDNSL